MDLTLYRSGKVSTLSLATAAFPKSRAKDRAYAQLGFWVEPMKTSVAKMWNIPSQKGVLVSRIRPGSPAAGIGLRPGDALLGLDDREINSENDLTAMLGRLDPGRPVKLMVQRGPNRYLVTLRPE